MLRPTKQSRRPCSCARSATICKRCREVAKQQIRTRPLRLRDDVREPLAHRPFRGRQARPVDVRGVGEQRQHAAAAIVRQGVQVAHALVGGRGIKLEVAGMNDGPERRGQGQRAGFDCAVGEVDEFHMEGTNLKRLAGMHLHQPNAVGQAVLFQLGASQCQGERRTVNGRVHFVQQIRQSPDVVFVRMRQQDGAQAFPVLPHVGEIRNNDVHAQQFGVREHDAAVDDDHVAVVFVRHHVHSELAQTAERDGF